MIQSFTANAFFITLLFIVRTLNLQTAIAILALASVNCNACLQSNNRCSSVPQELKKIIYIPFFVCYTDYVNTNREMPFRHPAIPASRHNSQ